MAPFSPFPRAHPRGRYCGGNPKYRLSTAPPLTAPLDSAPTRLERCVATTCFFYAGGMLDMNNPCCSLKWWGPDQAEPPRDGAALYCKLILLFPRLLANSLASRRGLHTLFFAGLQVKGVALDLLDHVFLLHLAFKSSQSVLEGLTLLKSNFCQTYTPPDSSGRTE